MKKRNRRPLRRPLHQRTVIPERQRLPPERAIDPAGSWFVVVCAAQAEREVELWFVARGMEAYAPMQRHFFLRRDKVEHRDLALLPRYVFVRAAPKERWCLFDCTAVSDVLCGAAGGAGERVPVALPAGFMGALLELQDGRPTRPPESPLEVGDRVRFTEGPFRDLVATIEATVGENAAAVALLNLFGRLSRVELSGSEVARVA